MSFQQTFHSKTSPLCILVPFLTIDSWYSVKSCSKEFNSYNYMQFFNEPCVINGYFYSSGDLNVILRDALLKGRPFQHLTVIYRTGYHKYKKIQIDVNNSKPFVYPEFEGGYYNGIHHPIRCILVDHPGGCIDDWVRPKRFIKSIYHRPFWKGCRRNRLY